MAFIFRFLEVRELVEQGVNEQKIAAIEIVEFHVERFDFPVMA